MFFIKQLVDDNYQFCYNNDIATKEFQMGYRVLGERDAKWQPREGLEGPFFYPNGQVLYYDPRAGQYWDPTTDLYVSDEDIAELQLEFARFLAKV